MSEAVSSATMSPGTMPAGWQVFVSADEVAGAACDVIVEAADKAIAADGVFRLVLAGGTTPEKVYHLLAKVSCDWSRWVFFLGDERCLPVDDAERNSVMAQRCLLDHINTPPDNIHFIPAELGAEQGALRYAEQLSSQLPFHLVLLGMGEDGHTASLFPGHEHDVSELVHAVHNAPKPPSDRVSLSRRCLSDAQRVLVLVTGAGKRAAAQAWRNGEALPVAAITAREQLDVFVDQAAMG